MSKSFLAFEQGGYDLLPEPSVGQPTRSGSADRREPELPTPPGFAFATGIECSYPTIMGADDKTIRRDLLEECGHYDRISSDVDLVRDLGLKYLRYGLPYYQISRSEGAYDWEMADTAMFLIKKAGITPILDLLHFGLPNWIGEFQNPDLPRQFARYCDAVAERYPWVRFYTPVNEMYVTAKMSALDGIWNERLRSDRAFVTALKHCSAAATLGCAAIVRRRPDAIIVTSETAEFVHDLRPVPDVRIKLENQLKTLSLDFLYAKQPDAVVYQFLLDNGMTREEFNWFMIGDPPGHHIMGNDYYGRNEKVLLPDGSLHSGEDVHGWYNIAKIYHNRYYKPIFHTEINVFDAEAAPSWLWKQWANVLNARRDGLPVVGFTWYSLIDQVDWDIGLSEKRGKINPCGLYDMDRNPRPVESAYRQLIEAFAGSPSLPHAEMYELAAIQLHPS